MLRVMLLRHGKTAGNEMGKFISITDESIADEEREALSKLNFPKVQAVYSSPMKRCTETAEILFPYAQAIIIPELSERNFGNFEGKTYKELIEDPEYKCWIGQNDTLSFPTGEDISEFNNRVVSALEKIIYDAKKKEKREIAIISHGGTIMSIMRMYGFPKQQYLQWMVNNGEGYRLRLSPEAFLDKSAKKERRIIVDGKIIRP